MNAEQLGELTGKLLVIIFAFVIGWLAMKEYRKRKKEK